MSVFVELSILLVITTVIAVLVRFLKQPMIIGYILAGIVVGPYALNILHSTEELEVFSKVGIVLLLFIVGLHLNPKVIKEVGKISMLAGVGQVVFTSIVGFIIAILLGISKVAAIYVAIALTFSSTIIILKLLSDKKDLQKMYAKIAVGFLLVQDIIASIILIAIAMANNPSDTDLLSAVNIVILKGAVLMVGLMVLGTYILPKVVKYVAGSQELLFIFSLAWGTGLASLFMLMGFSVEIGALVAGVSLSSTAYADEVASRMRPLRDFFIIMFFILLGSHMVLDDLGSIIIPALIFSVYVLVGNPVIMIILMNYLGYSRRTSFMSGLTVAQISEFSLIIATIGMQMGHLSQQTLSLVTLVGIITITASSYLILYSEKLYPRLENWIKYLELFTHNTKENNHMNNFTAVLFGYDRVGQDFITAFEKMDEKYCVVDFNPAVVERMEKENIPFFFGDASDVEFLEDLPVQKLKIAISTIPDANTNRLLIHHLHSVAPKSIVVVLAHTVEEARDLYEAGAGYVIMPHHLGAQYTAKLIHKFGTDNSLFKEEKTKHLKLLADNYGLTT
jgi:Kef-type K+ transport system membrane component KefB